MKESGSLGGILVVAGIALWFAGYFEENPPPGKLAIGKAYDPVSVLILQTQFRWATTVGVGLKLAGTILEIDYALSDGEKGRKIRSLSEREARDLRAGDKIKLTDADGVEREFILEEVSPSVPRIEGACVSYSLASGQLRHMDESQAFRVVQKIEQIPGIPYWYRPIAPNLWEVRYGPLSMEQADWCSTRGEAIRVANELRSLGFYATIK